MSFAIHSYTQRRPHGALGRCIGILTAEQQQTHVAYAGPCPALNDALVRTIQVTLTLTLTIQVTLTLTLTLALTLTLTIQVTLTLALTLALTQTPTLT